MEILGNPGALHFAFAPSTGDSFMMVLWQM